MLKVMKSKKRAALLVLISLLVLLLSLSPIVIPVTNTLRYYGIVKSKEYDDYATTASLSNTEIVSIVNYYLTEKEPTEEGLSDDKVFWIWKDEQYHLQIVSNFNGIYYDIIDLLDGIEYRFNNDSQCGQLMDKAECVVSEKSIRDLTAYDYAKMQRENEYIVYRNLWVYLKSKN